MKKTLIIFSLFALIVGGCRQNKPTTAENTETDLSVQIITDTLQTIYEMPIQQRFLSLIQHIDSAGFSFDTIRYKPRNCSIFTVSDYFFYEVPKETTCPFYAFALNEEFKKETEQCKDTVSLRPVYPDLHFDIKPLEKAQRVVEYFFKQKKPEIIDGQKWYTDGVIEEWTFATHEEAQKATAELMNSELCLMYFNTCAFICCAENNMYIFHSRAAAFMYTQKKFFKWFVQQNDITIKNE